MHTALKRLRIRQLEERTLPWRTIDPASPPRSGWIRAVRTALGMSTSQLASRLSITRQAIADLERREVDGTVTLAALRKAAEAMECDLLYAVVPRQPVREMIRARARALATERLKRVAHSMHLEDQSVPQAEFDRQVEDLADQIIEEFPRDLWTESVA